MNKNKECSHCGELRHTFLGLPGFRLCRSCWDAWRVTVS